MDIRLWVLHGTDNININILFINWYRVIGLIYVGQFNIIFPIENIITQHILHDIRVFWHGTGLVQQGWQGQVTT